MWAACGYRFRKHAAAGVYRRSMRAYGYPTYIRINVGLEAENRRFIRALKTVLS
jgi:histidinol-phosphate aminotransferase